MAALNHLVKRLRQAERELEQQLKGIRAAISSLEFGGGGVPRLARKKRAGGRARKRKTLSAKARRAIALAQKRRGGQQKAGG